MLNSESTNILEEEEELDLKHLSLESAVERSRY